MGYSLEDVWIVDLAAHEVDTSTSSRRRLESTLNSLA